ncbi:MAG: recombinase family protein [Aggregatilineales bacterium]
MDSMNKTASLPFAPGWTEYRRVTGSEENAQQGKLSHADIVQNDRFSRNSLEALHTVDELLALGLTVRIAAHPNLELETPNGHRILGMLHATAKLADTLRTRRAATGNSLARQWRNEPNTRR